MKFLATLNIEFEAATPKAAEAYAEFCKAALNRLPLSQRPDQIEVDDVEPA